METTYYNSCVYASAPVVITGIEENKSAVVFNVVPNPVTDIVTLQWNSGSVTPDEIQIIGINGAVIKTQQVTSGNATQIEVKDLPSGFYLLQPMRNGKVLSRLKMIKQ